MGLRDVTRALLAESLDNVLPKLLAQKSADEENKSEGWIRESWRSWRRAGSRSPAALAVRRSASLR
jgi:hypothetical protein